MFYTLDILLFIFLTLKDCRDNCTVTFFLLSWVYVILKVRAGVEMALIDAVANSIRVPLWRLFGGASNTITTDITVKFLFYLKEMLMMKLLVPKIIESTHFK